MTPMLRWAAAGLMMCSAGLVAGCLPTEAGRQLPVEIGEAPAARPPAGGGEPAAGPPSALTGPSAVDQPAGVGISPADRIPPMVPVYDPGKQLIRLAGCRKEVVSFQLTLVGPGGGLTGLKLSISDLEREGPRGLGIRVPALDRQTFDLFRVLPVRVARLPGWYQLYETGRANRASDEFPDAMVPADNFRHGQPWKLAADERLVVWADLPVPPEAEPGAYEGRLTISAEGFPTRSIQIKLDVLPAELPADPSLTLLCPLALRQMLARELGIEEVSDSFLYGGGQNVARKRLAQWIEIGRRHGVQFVVADAAPIVKRNLGGKVEVDWSGYDRLIGQHLVGPGAPPCWLAPFRLDLPDPSVYGGLESAAYSDLAGQYLREIGQHFAAAKWPQPIVWIHRDTPPQINLPYGASHWRDWLTEQRRKESVVIGRLVHMAEWDFGYLEPLPWSASGQAVPSHVSIYCPPAEHLTPTIIRELRGQPREAGVWLGEGDPPWRPSIHLFAPAHQLEALACLARRYNLQTIWLGTTQRWPARPPPADTLDASEADFLFYSGQWFGQDRPVASLRLKYLRQAWQNAGYLKLLADNGEGQSADVLTAAVAKYGLAEAASAVPGLGGAIGWLHEPVFLADARMMLRQILQSAVAKPGSAGEAFGQVRFRWLQFNERAAWMRLGACPGQLIDLPDSFGAPTGRMRAVFRIDAYADPAAVNPVVPGEPPTDTAPPALVFGDLPPTWKPWRFNVPVEPRQAGGRPSQTIALAADGRELPIDKTGRVVMPILLAGFAAAIESVRLETAVVVLPSHRFTQAPEVDGRLDDWPTESWYRGAGFRRLGPHEPVSLFHRAGPGQATDTWFMAGHDDRTIYLSVACLGQKPGQVTPRYANDVRFDRGLIVGEDAVQVVLDPTGGRLDREGLFHLAVKATGAVVGWRGMAGPAWGQNVRAQVRFYPEYWVAELAIPKAELAPVNEQGLWRLNVIRHVAHRGEHSAWASSYPFIGEPESLGNLLLRPAPVPRAGVPLAPVAPLRD